MRWERKKTGIHSDALDKTDYVMASVVFAVLLFVALLQHELTGE